MGDLTPEQKQALVQQALQQTEGRKRLFDLEGTLREIEAMLREKGVDEETLQFMSARARERWSRPSYTELARSLFPVQPMPLPSVLSYDRDPDVAGIVSSDDDSKE